MIHFEETPEFQKEYKRLAKKYKSLCADFGFFKKRILEKFPKGFGNHMSILRQERDIFIIKARLACESLRGSFIRVIYAYCESTVTIFFIELYYKGDKESEDRRRIEEFLKLDYHPPGHPTQ